MNKFRISLIAVPILIFAIIIGSSIVNAEATATFVMDVYLFIAKYFGAIIQVTCFIFLAGVIYVAFSKVGNIKFGGKDAKPELSTWAYFTIALCAGIGTGIMFWGPIEPLYFAMAPPQGVTMAAGSPEAIQFAMNKSFMHWAFTPYALYALCGLSVAYAVYNMKMPNTVSSGMTLLYGEKFTRSKYKDVVDAIALTAICSGLAGGLGNGLIQLGAGIEMISGIPSGPVVWISLAVSITVIYTISSVSGLQKGIKFLSDKNAWIFIAFLTITIVAGPTKYIIDLTAQSFGHYLDNIISSSIFTSPGNTDMWPEWWDTFYLADWLSFAPLVGLFLARISYGRTIREFIMINLIAPAMFAVVWFGAFGGFVLDLQFAGKFDMFNYMMTAGFDGVMLKVAEFLPLGNIIQPIIIVTIMLSYVTMADSMTSSISIMSLKDTNVKEAPIAIKIFWGSLMGALAVIFVTVGGIDGVKTLLAISGLPVMIVMVFMFAGVMKRLVVDKNYSVDELKPGKEIGLKKEAV
ncbi:Choline-glycine betaine transporter [Dethiosulfatibacter aminovorans DSM 17477]|uniref:Choline-glycine betaine transporter n=1 Tax=Dethiosulfatibacter aminovorans DSM 17477 TaxID=1121476 RepID=A0A1M6BKJ1_9FIRM|nr:BCCT family transporter [Dethiosulfatibacter aminovorans]SHI49003.1 Choline-glycine betaine transporter [Dethiosulfatibacter aminovorans DSM 17477]